MPIVHQLFVIYFPAEFQNIFQNIENTFQFSKYTVILQFDEWGFPSFQAVVTLIHYENQLLGS